MGQEIESLENAAAGLPALLQAAAIDYRLIMVAEHGSSVLDTSACVCLPLGGVECGVHATPPVVGAPPHNNPPVFYHYSRPVGSLDAWAVIYNSFTAEPGFADQFGSAPSGWSAWLRKDALKCFIVVTDDGVSCTVNGVPYNDGDTVADGEACAESFDTELLSLPGGYFGSSGKPRYIWFSVIGMKENSPADEPWLPNDPITTETCPDAVSPGTAYQALSIKTGGLRFAISRHMNFSLMLERITARLAEKLAD
jgi:hypothetical protein